MSWLSDRLGVDDATIGTVVGYGIGTAVGMPTVGAAIGGSIGAGMSGSDAADDAARAQERAAQAGISEQRRQFDITQEQMAPFREAGVSALGQQQALLGMGTPEEQAAAMAAFAETPGQQFLRNQQERALLRNASAIGGLGGGNVRTALQEQAFGRAQTDYGNYYNRLAGMSGTGQTTTAQLGQFGSGTASNIANLQAAGGAARASGILGQQQAQAQMAGNLLGLGAQFGAFSPSPVQPTGGIQWAS